MCGVKVSSCQCAGDRKASRINGCGSGGSLYGHRLDLRFSPDFGRRAVVDGDLVRLGRKKKADKQIDFASRFPSRQLEASSPGGFEALEKSIKTFQNILNKIFKTSIKTIYETSSKNSLNNL